MKQKKIPMRMCLGCRESKPKKDLIRVVKNKENEISVDLTGKMHGRGAYICRGKLCLEKAIKGKRFEKSFEMTVSPEVFDILNKQMEEIDE
ncbi:MAG TPA: YlxR family protein [Clostridiales bacterium]|nr:YlxR family protein [Clostridiales bacterium]